MVDISFDKEFQDVSILEKKVLSNLIVNLFQYIICITLLLPGVHVD